jgi:pimeloyl-ACP methyl ester carboxylesterase
MSGLEVPGARLYYEATGAGPLFVLIPGAPGSADSYRMIAGPLAEHYTVVAYDRRGFSHSALDGPQDYDHRVETDADDVRRLIEHLSDKPAIVFGNSSGAIVGLEVLIHHPSSVRRLIAHEPPAVRQLAEGQQWLDFLASIYHSYRQSGLEPAMNRFSERMVAGSDRQIIGAGPKNEFFVANSTYWFEHEVRQYPAITLDLDALRRHADRIVLAVRRDSRGFPSYEANAALGHKLGRTLVEMPGGHLGYVTRAADFARALRSCISDAGKPDEQ